MGRIKMAEGATYDPHVPIENDWDMMRIKATPLLSSKSLIII